MRGLPAGTRSKTDRLPRARILVVRTLICKPGVGSVGPPPRYVILRRGGANKVALAVDFFDEAFGLEEREGAP
ncbi:hypothetical protein GCM10017667_56480 [Streptomyces filamentosus]|uniref:Uncharacterized protein n=1 Tax=Streptomyces filamentosus TaxID=67294 RepID=A0A919BTZ3_STRFL|nr:hypothetical protein GCM10017667_56480 [Streptomyces filamentosus]